MIAGKKNILRIQCTGEAFEEQYNNCEDWVAEEVILNISINRKILAGFACSPVQQIDLCIGFLFTEKIISTLESIDSIVLNHSGTGIDVVIKNIHFDENEYKDGGIFTSGCGRGIISRAKFREQNLIHTPSSFEFSADYFLQLINALKTNSEWYFKTGCIHQSALTIETGESIIREDIGRHNAVDKVIGAGLRAGFNFHKSILTCSGRLSSDMLLKSASAQIPVVISRAAPTSLAVNVAQKYGITLIGFARGKKMNVYSNPERILSAGKKKKQKITESYSSIFNNKLSGVHL